MPSDDTLRIYKHVLPSQFGALSKTVLVQVIGKKVPSLPRDKTLLGVLTCGVKAKCPFHPPEQTSQRVRERVRRVRARDVSNI